MPGPSVRPAEPGHRGARCGHLGSEQQEGAEKVEAPLRGPAGGFAFL